MTDELYFEDLEVGMRWTSARRTVTESDISTFAGVSGDFSPLHTDELSARTRGFGGRIAHGALILSIATGLRQQMGLFLSSHRGLLEIRSWRFLAPVRPGDTVDTVTTVSSLRRTSQGNRGIVVQGVEVRNQRGEVVQTGELVTLIAARDT